MSTLDQGGPTPEQIAEAYRHQPQRRIRIALHGGGSYIKETARVSDMLDDLAAELDDAAVGDSITITFSIVELSDAEYEALPEFAGH